MGRATEAAAEDGDRLGEQVLVGADGGSAAKPVTAGLADDEL